MDPVHVKRSTEFAAAAFVVGMGVMAIEITASRILAPYFGASMFVWTSIIVTVLLALSCGYWIGGIVAERHGGTRILGVVFLGSALLLVSGVWSVGFLTARMSGSFLGATDAGMLLFAGSLLSSFVIFSVPVFLLAMAGPIILKEWSKGGGDIGRVSGRYFAVSTGGSVVGTVAPTLYLVPAFGARATMSAIAALFIIVGIKLLFRDRRTALAAVLFVPVPFLFAGQTSYPPGTVAAVESPYQLIRVEDTEEGRILVFNEGSGMQSVYAPGRERTWRYYDYFIALPLLHEAASGPRRAAIIGLAGGTAVRQYRKGLPEGDRADVVGVEVDSAVIDVARGYFSLDDIGVRVVNADGRMFLASGEEMFDDIIIDAYSTQLYIAPHLATREFFEQVRASLRDGGVVAMNVNAPRADSRLLATLTNTIASVFSDVTVVPATDWNYLVLASDTELDISSAAERMPEGYGDIGASLLLSWRVSHDPGMDVFTDDRAPVEMLTDTMILEELLLPGRG